MALTINHQTNDISATSGSVTIDGSPVGGGGSLSAATISGASQTVDFSAADIFQSTIASKTTTFTFSNPSSVDKATIIFENQLVDPWASGGSYFSGEFATIPFDPAWNPSVRAIRFDSTGVNLFALDVNTELVKVALTTAYDLSTLSASYSQFINVDTFTVNASHHGFSFADNGTKIYFAHSTSGYSRVDLSTAYDLSTASAVFNRSFSGTINDIAVKSDGTRYYLALAGGLNQIVEINPSVAYGNVTSTVVNTLNLPAAPYSLSFKPDGTKMFVMITSGGREKLYTYEFSTAWDLSSASFLEASVELELIGSGNVHWGHDIKSDGSKFYAADYSGGQFIREFNMNGAIVLQFPASLQTQPLTMPIIGEKLALTLVTSDSGSSYQSIAASEAIE